MSHIYISYRHNSRHIAKEIFDWLRMLGLNAWIDIHCIPPGADFQDLIDETIRTASAMVVVIGRNWMPRLHNNDDHVRKELEEALQRDIPTIPILVDGARMPDSTELPESLRELPERSSATLDSKANLLPDMSQVTRALRDFADSKVPKPKILKEGTVKTSHSPSKKSRVEAASSSPPIEDTIEFGVSFPPGLRRHFIVDAWMYRRKDRQKALKRAKKERSPLKFRSAGATLISRQTLVTVELSVPSCKVEPASQEVIWDGRITNASFKVSAPDALAVGETIGTCNFCVSGLRIGQVLFEILLTKGVAQQQVSQSSAVKSAFASYASQDRSRVLARVQGIEKLGVRVFMDVRNLKSGDPYPVELFQHIDASDVLYLFWSRHASRSEWVEKEWRYCLVRKGAEFIDPVPLDDPRNAPPPPELARIKHFTDWTLIYLGHEKSLSRRGRLGSWTTDD